MVFTSLFISILLFFSVPPKIDSTEKLLQAMKGKYDGKWARTLTFTQYNTHYKGDSVSTSVWYEAIEYPDKFRIDFGEPKIGNAVIFTNDSVYQFKGGVAVNKKLQPNDLMLLAGGIYFMSLEKVMQRLQNAGYDTNLFHENTWQGRPVYVVGANRGDTQIAQFWIDKEHFYLVRTITPLPNTDVQEAQFSKHIQTSNGWTETEVLFLLNGKLEQKEEYKNIQVNTSLPDGLFTLHKFGKIHWMP